MSIYRSLPDRPSLAQLKAQAKELLSAARAGEVEALRRLTGSHPRAAQALAAGVRLSDAQLVLAREYDFASWPVLHAYVASGTGRPLSELRKALQQGDRARLEELLVAHPELPAARLSPHNDTPLHLATKNGQAELAELLIERGARLDACNSWGGTPLLAALIEGRTQLAELLLARGAQPLTLAEASGVGRLELLAAFWDESGRLRPEAALRLGQELSPGVWQRDSGAPLVERDVVQSAFEYACRNGRLNAAQFLLERGADVHAPGFFGAPPLHWAASRGQNEMVKFLVGRGAEIGRRDPKFDATAFGWAREFERQSTLQLLRELGYAPDIWEAASSNDVERLRQLLDAAPELLDSQRWGTPLCEACAWGQEAAARFLIERGCNRVLPARDGQRPLELARQRGLSAIVELLERLETPDET